MSVDQPIGSDHQLARLLQIGVVLEEVVEVRAHRNYQALPAESRDEAIEALLSEARAESAEHRERLERLIDALDAESIAVEEIESLVTAQYEADEPAEFDGVLYDQLNGEETAWKFYDDLLAALEATDVSFGVERELLETTLAEIRAAEADGVEAVTRLMNEQSDQQRLDEESEPDRQGGTR